jgi:beta-phosphoglucomutase-like phosphatase (HAD superfamily)
LVLVGVTPVDLPADTGREQVRAVLVVGDHATGVKAAERADAIRVGGGDHPAEPAAWTGPSRFARSSM